MFDFESLLKDVIPKHMLSRALLVMQTKLKPIRILCEQRRVPQEGWEDEVVDLLLTLLSFMDTDKDIKGGRIGEREARTASPLVSKLAHGFCHGIGRSGSIAEPQPKAGGASLAHQLANRLALDMLQRTGAPNLNSACVLPVATGMAISLAVARTRDETGRCDVVYARVDHRSPIKGIQLAGMKIKNVDGEVFGDAVKIPLENISDAVSKETAAIVSTTTFFPPREPDNIKAIAKLAADMDIFHIVNNAYGVQSREIMKLIHSAVDAGRVDAVIQSTDKNFLTPVGGSIIASPSSAFVEKVSSMYAGRASSAPIIQFLAAILSLGVNRYESLRDEQEENRRILGERLSQVADKHGERLLKVINPIASAMTLSNHKAKVVGHHMYTQRITGPRVLEETDFGVCCKKYHSPYITINAAIGSKELDLHKSLTVLAKILSRTKR